MEIPYRIAFGNVVHTDDPCELPQLSGSLKMTPPTPGMSVRVVCHPPMTEILMEPSGSKLIPTRGLEPVATLVNQKLCGDQFSGEPSVCNPYAQPVVLITGVLNRQSRCLPNTPFTCTMPRSGRDCSPSVFRENIGPSMDPS